jgi:hypothetical protein
MAFLFLQGHAPVISSNLNNRFQSYPANPLSSVLRLAGPSRRMQLMPHGSTADSVRRSGGGALGAALIRPDAHWMFVAR